MCGIAGYLELNSPGKSHLENIYSMISVLDHRGPDDSDVWIEANSGIALGHSRLSIIDLSEAGRQPMTSSCGRYVITYNGEIYNADQLRQELLTRNRVFRGHSDTEVILEGCACWGIEKTLERLIGMFAFGIWDKNKRELILVRDRLGIKPLYWSFKKGIFLFGSELKALRQVPSFDPTINRSAVISYLRHNCIGGGDSIYQSTHKLLPGHVLRFTRGKDPEVRSYWKLEDAVSNGKMYRFDGSDDEAVNALESILEDAVKLRMVSDVPIGAFLSGGIDSSTVVALMQKSSLSKVRTFSIGFENADYNEAVHASAVAQHLNTDHTELYVSSQQARDVIPKLAQIYDEPFADSSQIPTYLVSSLTRKHVTVSLSGDGGDELFGGYNRYIQAQTMMRLFWSLPAA
ncbi:MAG: asparagine synthase (glutamine-hydrolyzing), partial [Desulfobulbia bacterium]